LRKQLNNLTWPRNKKLKEYIGWVTIEGMLRKGGRENGQRRGKEEARREQGKKERASSLVQQQQASEGDMVFNGWS
jgi:hypothetical protein